MMDRDDVEFINQYRKMTNISDLCNKYKVGQSNLVQGKVNKAKTKLIANKLRYEVINLYNYIILEDIAKDEQQENRSL